MKTKQLYRSFHAQITCLSCALELEKIRVLSHWPVPEWPASERFQRARLPNLGTPAPTSRAGDLGDLHVYDPVAMAWTNLSAAASGTPPVPRYWHGFTTVGGRLYVHGGLGDDGDFFFFFFFLGGGGGE